MNVNIPVLARCAVLLALATAATAQQQAPLRRPQQGARPAAEPAPAAAPATTPAPAKPSVTTPQGNFEVYEWVVLLCDPNQPAANAERMFQSTLPEFVGSRRAAAPAESANEPSPGGVIRVVSPDGAAETTKVDVLVQCPSGRFLAAWPKGKGRTNRQLWEAYELRSESKGLKELPPGHWLAALRETPSLGLHRGRAGERFLLYDAELNYPLPLRAAGGEKQTYELSNSGAAPLHDVTLFKPQDSGWRTAAPVSLPAAKGVTPATKPATAPATAPAMPPEIAARSQAQRVAARRPGVAPPPAAPVIPPSTQPVPGASKAAVTADGPGVGATEALSAWKQRLADLGLAGPDVVQVLRILERHALDKKRMTVVYRLDPPELERLLPLEVTPVPRKTVRVGLVIARNIDPAVGDEIDQLIAQLADPDWDKREAAHKQLADLGPAARIKLQAVLQNKDLEVVWRAERLLQAADAPPGAARRR